MDDEVKQLKILVENGLAGVYKKKTYFVMAENNFIKNPKYTMSHKMVYLCLSTYSGAVSSCFPSKSTMSKDLNTSVKTIERVLKQLQVLGAIIIVNQITENNRMTSNLYILSDIDKDTGNFIPESIEKFKELSEGSIKIQGK